jgi:hypothetical protein
MSSSSPASRDARSLEPFPTIRIRKSSRSPPSMMEKGRESMKGSLPRPGRRSMANCPGLQEAPPGLSTWSVA